ncbi:MAG: NAD(P)/FAD-dependent oxidoreductase [Ilumatobacter sp.]|uniref:NAD(P)/FAD-dependent oxidoreductase n=1 Tax=Ilumatobacter sp. TaxID=1967498 RepID=UPI002619BA3E|nr:NAD(P)/FAD-dependent oxidoreductase [Ilumatobacter sp.]MDJ0767174.1 NAD(P)/FAD-dependent oxidoreductase [Ilumatobacter sp.]
MAHVVIIGGGPAGSALGSYLSLAGIDNTILERAIHPRPHVGESMVTASTRIFNEIGFWETFDNAGFVRKYGAAWHPPTGRGEFDIAFAEFPQEGVDVDYTYHVDRSKFDLMLLKHAESLGSRIHQGVAAQRVVFEDGFARGVEVCIGDQPVTIQADAVVDASGRDTLLGRQLGIKNRDPIFNQFAIHAWFENVDRGVERTADYIRVYFLPLERSWVWQIPITPEITSVGVVVHRDVFRASELGIEDFFAEQLGSTPELRAAMGNARRVNDVKSEGDYSYSMEHFVGNGYLLAGDAARFVDPIFSSGVSVALSSAKLASEALVAGFAKGDVSAESLRGYETTLRGGVEIWYEFIRLYYKLMHTFTYFIQEPEHRLQVLELLQGQVYDRDEVPVLQKMRDFIDAVERSDGHLLKAHLTDMPIG